MQRQQLIAVWEQEEREPFVGWDFAHLSGRMLEDQPPWSYSKRAGELMRQARSVLDLGTGGGERLLALREHWPPRVAATEGYPPNLALARQRLSTYGVEVEQAVADENSLLPFANGAFDLIIDRHTSFNAAEVMRVLAPGGVFFTQQVHGLWAEDLLARFGATPPWPYATPDYFGRQLKESGLKLADRREWTGKLSFTDVGAIVYYLKAVPWLVPGFSVATHLESLLGLQEQVEADEPLTFTAWKYVLAASKP